MNDFQRILSQVLIEDVINQYVPLKKTGQTLSACCPFHAEKSPSFKVYPSNQSFFCFGCHAGGDAVTFIEKYLGLEPFEALKQLASSAGLPPPEQKQRNDISVAKEDAVAALWEACLPTPTGLGSKMQDAGWLVRDYDAMLLEATSSVLGPLYNQVANCGLTAPGHSGFGGPESFRPIDNAWILAGQRLVGSGPKVTGFAVVSGTNLLRIEHRLTSETSPASLIFNQKAIGDRLSVKNVLLTESPLRAMQCSRRYVSISCAGTRWRPQDVRNVRSAFPNATFLIDRKHFSDTSLLGWISQLGADALMVKVSDDTLDGSRPTTPVLTALVEEITARHQHQSATDPTRPHTVLSAIDFANSLLDALSQAPETKMLLGQEFQRAGLPVTYAVELPPAIAPAVPAAPRLLFSYQVTGPSAHLLENALLMLPFIDLNLWREIPSTEFGEHSPMAEAITQFLGTNDLHMLSPARFHAAFWAYVWNFNSQSVPSALADFWLERLANSPAYWEELPARDSYQAAQCRSEVQEGVRHFLVRMDKKKKMTLAHIAQIDQLAEEQLRASYRPANSA